MTVAVAVLAELDLHVVTGKLERRGHPRILEIPAAGVVHQILTAGLHEDADRPRLSAPDETRQAIGAAEIAEAANPGDHPPELVRPVPRGDERADAAGAQAGDAAFVRIARQRTQLRYLGNQFLDQEVREPRRQRVVLEDAFVAVLRRLRERRHHARVDEDRGHRRQVAFRDQVVEHDRHTHVVAGVAAAIEEDHERQRTARVALRRHVHLIVVRGAREELSRRQHVARHGALRDSRLRLRVRPERIVGGRQSAGRRRHGRRLRAEPDRRAKEDVRGRVSHRFEGIFGLPPPAVISLVSRSTARSTGRLSAIEIGVRPAAFSSSSLAP